MYDIIIIGRDQPVSVRLFMEKQRQKDSDVGKKVR